MKKLIGYPLNSACLNIAIHPFSILGGTWFDWVHRNHYSEAYKREANSIWWLRVGPFTFSYRRML